jgi:hypothetical protein
MGIATNAQKATRKGKSRKPFQLGGFAGRLHQGENRTDLPSNQEIGNR